MNKKVKTAGMVMALLAAAPMSGSQMAYAASANDAAPMSSVQQNEAACKGVVKDATGEGVIGASIVVEGTNLRTVTDLDGNFTLTGVKKGATIQISYIGYTTKTVKWNGAPLDILLEDDKKMLDEVVVVGFGTQKKVNLTGAVSTVDSKTLSSRPVNSVVDALQGAVAGMNFSTSSSGGTLNSSKSFNIRGTGTIGAGSSVSPLVLIDGMEGDMNALNPQDIENISVLKDASASSIYGSRAAGGVILITTKSGKKGKTSINYNNSFRFDSPLNMPEMMDSYTWAKYMNDASVNSGAGVWFTDDKLEQIKKAQSDPTMQKMFKNVNNRWEVWDNTPLLPLGNTDWLKEQFGNSFSQEHTLSMNGGDDRIQYYLSANYLDRGGLLRHGNDNTQRYAFTGKVSAQLADWLRVTYNTRFSRSDFESPNDLINGTDVFYHNMCRYWPILPTQDPNGHWLPESYIERLENGGRAKNQTDRLSQQLSFVATPVKGLTLNAELNYRILTQFNHREWLTTYGYDCDNNPFVDSNATSSVYEYSFKSNYFNPNLFAEYSRAFGDHNMKVMGGFQSEWFRQRNISAQQNGIMSGLPTLDTTTNKPSVGGAYNSWTTAGFFGRINYDYAGRYLFEANLRYDGSSRFLRENRWNFFPSFSAGWNIAQEKFWEPMAKYVNTLKLRASWGQLGNQNTDNWYPFYPTIGFTSQGGNWLINNAKPNVASQPSLVSSTLTWEKSRTWEVGVDWGAFNNRLTGSFGYYQRKTFDMVGPAPELPVILGANPPKVNNLDMTSKGWDLQISWRDIIGEVSYGASFVLSDNQVVIDKYPNPSKNLGSYYNGAKLGDIWGYTTIGIANSQEEMDKHLSKVDQSALGSGWTAGDIMYKDLDGDGKINGGEGTADKPGDRRIIGNSTPRYNFGLNLDAAWKGFDIKVFFQGTLKRDYAAGGQVFWGATGGGKWQATGFKFHEDYWREDNKNAYYPRANWSGGRDLQTQTRYLQNAAYARLKNLTIGYTLPKELTRKVYIENLRFFVSGENLLTITNFTEAGDPELVGAGYGGEIGKTYPLSKTFSCGLSVTF